jgi:hypothetical protein
MVGEAKLLWETCLGRYFFGAKKNSKFGRKKTRAKKVFWGPLKTKKQTNQKSKQTKKANKPKKTNKPKGPKQKSGEKHFICFSGAYLPRRCSAPLLFWREPKKFKKGAGRRRTEKKQKSVFTV